MALALACFAASALCLTGEDTPVEAPNPRVTGSPSIQTWRTEDITGHPVNRQVVVHPVTGYVFVANSGGVLVFDGVRWQLIPMPNSQRAELEGFGRARELAIDGSGRVWAATPNDVAVLVRPDLDAGEAPAGLIARSINVLFAPDSTGAHGPPTSRYIADNAFPQVMNTPQGMVVRSNKRIFLFGPNELKQSWNIPDLAAEPWWSEGALHILRENDGIHRLERGPTVKLNFSDVPNVLAAFPQPGGGTLWLTTEGPWLVQGDAVTPMASAESQELLRNAIATSAVVLADGGAAFATQRRGVVVLDASGDLREIIDSNRGLTTDRINDLSVDDKGGLWLGTHVGIFRIQFDTPFATHGLTQGFRGRPRDLQRVGERLYVAHTEGLAWRDTTTGRFHDITGAFGDIHQIARVGDTLLVAADSLFSVKFPDSFAVANLEAGTRAFKAVSASRSFPGSAFVGDSHGTWLAEPNPDSATSPWSIRTQFTQTTTRASGYYDNGAGQVWISPRFNEVYQRLDLRDGIAPGAAAASFGKAVGLPTMETTHRIGIFDTGNRFWAVSRLGVWRWDAADSRFVLEPQFMEAGMGPEAAGSADGHGWMYFASPHPLLRKIEFDDQGAIEVTDRVVPELTGVDVNNLYFDEALQTLWVDCQIELLSFDPNWETSNPSSSWSTRIARVTTNEGSKTLWATSPYQAAATASNLALEPTQRAVRVEFAAPSFFTNIQTRSPLRFRSYIDPIDHEWSPWSEETYRDLTNLPDGAVTITVEARNVATQATSTHQLTLQVLPPWWRTPVAYGCWSLLGLAAIAGLVRTRTQVLRRRNEALESVVTERTAELTRLRQIDRDESAAAKLAEEKTRLEMLRYQLNPHFLYNALNSIRALTFSRPPAAGEMVQQLADLCRVTLTRNEDLAPVADELAMLRLYLDMEKTRWREKLQITIHTTPAANACKIPPFLLLPLVENALKHGGRNATGVMNLGIHARLEAAALSDQSALIFEITNNGRWRASGESIAPSTGIGLENLRQRLKRYYPDAHELRTKQIDDQVVVTIRLDLSTTDSALAVRPDGV